jgi:trimethylamine---corrinoid protein Co-methyltransferase
MHLTNIKVLSDSEMELVHEASVNLLFDTGIKVMSEDVLAILETTGALVDYPTQIVRFPPQMTRQYTSGLREKIQLYNRSQESYLTLGDGRVHCASGHNAIYTQKFESDLIQDATKQDVREFAFVTDALENLEVAGVVVMPCDVSPQASLVHAIDAMFNNTTKHVFFSPGTAKETAAILDIARAVTGKEDLSERPVLTCQLSPTSPLTWETGAVEALVYIAKSGIPLTFLPGPMGGATCPYTLAGHFTQYNAEMLSGIIISQVINRRTPVIYGGGWSIFDMRESIAKIATPESVLLRIAGVQMAHFYRIPCHSMGLDSDSHCYDEQQGMEKLFTALGDFEAGADLFVNGGMYSSGVTASLEQLVIDDEISGILYRFMQGIDFTPEKMALDSIREVGPGGNFLSHDHTLKYLRTGEHRLKELSLRYSLRKWKEQGKPDLITRARERVRRILSTHKVEPLAGPIQQSITEIINEFESNLLTEGDQA